MHSIIKIYITTKYQLSRANVQSILYSTKNRYNKLVGI